MMWQSVSNADRKFGEALVYWYTIGPYGKPILVTDPEISRTEERAAKNPEDLPALSILVPVEMTP